MPGNSFYTSEAWKRLRKAVLERDGYKCTVEGCRRRAFIVDHIQTRPRGVEELTDWDKPGNLRSLCRTHDNQVKEKRDGTRKNDGVMYLPGNDTRGFPLDPKHPWFNGGEDDE